MHVDEFTTHLLGHDHFVITTHLKPDGDAIGSQIALGGFLEKQGKDVLLINADHASSNLDWLPGSERIQVFNGSLDQLEKISAADAIVVVDTNSKNRLGNLGDLLANSSAEKMLVDHHPAPEKWFDRSYQRESASSTGQLVYEIIAHVDASVIDAPIATSLYVAIMTDTGSFRYSNVNADVHRCVADILERGDINPEPIHDALFDTRSPGSLRLLGRALDNIRITEDGVVGYLVISRQMLQDAGADRDDTEGFVNYILSVEGVKVALFFYEVDSGVKVSLRSKAEYRVDRLARSLGGGGHRNASGIFIEEDLDVAVSRVLNAVPGFIRDDSSDTEEVSDDEVAFYSSLMEEKQRNKEV